MKLYIISQNEATGYDTYDSAIVTAETELEARRICPCSFYKYNKKTNKFNWDTGEDQDADANSTRSSWAESPDQVSAEYIGEAKEGTQAGLILASFNAG